jgi:hypothetical protein
MRSDFLCRTWTKEWQCSWETHKGYYMWCHDNMYIYMYIYIK